MTSRFLLTPRRAYMYIYVHEHVHAPYFLYGLTLLSSVPVEQ